MSLRIAIFGAIALACFTEMAVAAPVMQVIDFALFIGK